jgi:hypothetical protein
MTNLKNNIWAEFSKEINGKFIKGYSWHSDRTEVEYNNWKIIFDNYTLWSGKYSTEMTRVIVPFISVDNFKFQIYRNSFLRKIEGLFGVQDVKIGRTDFDKAFVIKSNNVFKIKSLLQNQKIRRIIELQKEVNILISDQKGIWDEKLPENEFELSFFADGEIRDFECLKSLLNLFKEMIDSLYQMKSIDNIKPL